MYNQIPFLLKLITITKVFDSIFTGVIANIVFTVLLIYVLQQFRYWYYLKRKFHNSKFNTYWKYFPDEVVQAVTCTVRRNIIKFEGSRKSDEASFSGELIINPINLKTGEGFHIHSDIQGWGFLKVIIKDNNTLLIEAPYIKIEEEEGDSKEKIRTEVHQAFIWVRQQNKD